MEGGSYIERTFTGSAPARGVGVYVGDELLNMTRRQNIKKFQVEPHRLVVAINIPKKELQMNSGKLAVVRLIEEYPQSVMEGAKADINSYLLTGVSRGIVFQTAELKGLLSLSGDVSDGIGTGVTNGLIDFVTPAAQATAAEEVQGVAKATSYFHYNNYDTIGTFSSEGISKLRKMYRTCAHYAGSGKGPDLVIMDDGTYTNFEKDRRDLVRIKVVEDKTEKSNTLELGIGVAKVYSSIDLEPSNFSTSAATEGVAYYLNTDYLEMPMSEAPNISEFKERVGDQDVVTALFSMQANLICTKLVAQGVVTSGV
tara:strand:- start:7471 stop:8406 length:936 start_codon:yes stop_codon:yes gene_type:complete